MLTAKLVPIQSTEQEWEKKIGKKFCFAWQRKYCPIQYSIIENENDRPRMKLPQRIKTRSKTTFDLEIFCIFCFSFFDASIRPESETNAKRHFLFSRLAKTMNNVSIEPIVDNTINYNLQTSKQSYSVSVGFTIRVAHLCFRINILFGVHAWQIK